MIVYNKCHGTNISWFPGMFVCNQLYNNSGENISSILIFCTLVSSTATVALEREVEEGFCVVFLWCGSIKTFLLANTHFNFSHGCRPVPNALEKNLFMSVFLLLKFWTEDVVLWHT